MIRLDFYSSKSGNSIITDSLCISLIVSILFFSTTAVFFIKLVPADTILGPPIEPPMSPVLLLNDEPTTCLTSIVPPPGDFVKVYLFIVPLRLPSLWP